MSDTAILLSLLALAAVAVIAAVGAAVGAALTWAWLRVRAQALPPAAPPAELALRPVALPAAAPSPRPPPAAVAKPGPAAAPSPPPAPTAWTADVLVVDDSAVARAKLRRLLESRGYSVQLANDGVDALALLEQGRYALMISDLEMPNMDGVTLIHTCLSRPQTARMPILAISGHENLRVRFNACHDICGVHRKPWVDDVLASHVATLVGTRPPGPPPSEPPRPRAARTAVAA